MSYILNIDTAISSASVCLSKNGEPQALAVNPNQKDQAAWLQPAIDQILKDNRVEMRELSAVAVSVGPGSYTGLRIGLSASKGICYALGIPLIAVGTLEMMAAAADDREADLRCPMIDARRMEVFTAVYTNKSETLLEPCAMILDENSFSALLNDHTILFFGNGSLKYKSVVNHPNAIFETIETNALQLVKISDKRLHAEDFNSVAYTEPMYIKNFYSSFKEPLIIPPGN